MQYSRSMEGALLMNIVELTSNTSYWSLVIHQVSQQSAQIWIGTLFGTLRQPTLARLILSTAGQEIQRVDLTELSWQRPLSGLNQRFYQCVLLTDLVAANHYDVAFYQQLAGPGFEEQSQWQLLKRGSFTTLPAKLPAAERPFTVALSSCFYPHRDAGRAAAAYKALYQQGGVMAPDIKFLVGDQVYLDIGLDSLSPLPPEIRQRVVEDYALSWQALGSMLSRGGCWMLPDDHEYWNDYPFYDSLLPTLFMLKLPPVRRVWRQAATEAVKNIQQTSSFRTFCLGDDLAFCLVDVRSERNQDGFVSTAVLQQLLDWLLQLRCPGVLVMSQVLLENIGAAERNLANFPAQYQALLQALSAAQHDIVLLSGDVHFARIAEVRLAGSDRRLIEVVASPLSNLTGMNSLATATMQTEPRYFPDPDHAASSGVTPQAVIYHQGYQVPTEPGQPGSSYWRDRTAEHFMTLSFHLSSAGVEMQVQAWLVRHPFVDQLPTPAFVTPFRTVLS